MKLHTIGFAGIFAVFLMACVTTPTNITVTFYSDPPGARLYSGSRYMGVTPLSLAYATQPTFLQGGCQNNEHLMVRWGSGAEASLPALSLCSNIGYYQQISFIRPTGVPGRELDMQFAIEIERNAALRQQAAAQSQQAQAQTDAAFIQAWGAINAAKTSNKINCTTRQVGSSVYTSCN